MRTAFLREIFIQSSRFKTRKGRVIGRAFPYIGDLPRTGKNEKGCRKKEHKTELPFHAWFLFLKRRRRITESRANRIRAGHRRYQEPSFHTTLELFEVSMFLWCF